MSTDKIIGLGLREIRHEVDEIGKVLERVTNNPGDKMVDEVLITQSVFRLDNINKWLQALQDIYPPE